jgi:hypothetical protein
VVIQGVAGLSRTFVEPRLLERFAFALFRFELASCTL